MILDGQRWEGDLDVESLLKPKRMFHPRRPGMEKRNGKRADDDGPQSSDAHELSCRRKKGKGGDGVEEGDGRGAVMGRRWVCLKQESNPAGGRVERILGDSESPLAHMKLVR